jgi:membrane dipeptidase
VAGNANHVGIGSDLDGAYGREQTAVDLTTIADLARIPMLLAERGYAPGDIQNIAHGNFNRVLAARVDVGKAVGPYFSVAVNGPD